jgi:hypothetical protein
MCFKVGRSCLRPRPSSAMSPAGYSLAVLSSNRLRFADRLQWWGSFRLRSTGKTSQSAAGGRRRRRQNRQKCGRFIPALTDNCGWRSPESRCRGRNPQKLPTWRLLRIVASWQSEDEGQRNDRPHLRDLLQTCYLGVFLRHQLLDATVVRAHLLRRGHHRRDAYPKSPLVNRRE